MAEPVAEQIVANVRSRVAAYSAAYRPTRIETWSPKDSDISVVQGEQTKNDELSCPGNPPAQAWDMEVSVTATVKPSDRDATPTDTLKNRVAAEIIKAANTGSVWHTWGGLAINSTVERIESDTDDDGAFSAARVVFLITFRTDENNPFNVRA